MKRIKKVMASALLLGTTGMAPAIANAGDGVEVNHLGVNNTLVRVTGEGKYLLLPVQESNDDARINVLVDGKIAETIYVRLAKSKTDFTVPYDLSPYKGKNVVLDIVTPQSRASVREAKGDVCWKGMELSDNFDTTNREKFRPLFHHTPQYGWMNDPNGMFFDGDKWHLYYQWNPYGSKWQNMTWGHSTSSDLIHWEPQAVAIRPDGLGSIFSGSSVIDRNNTAGFGENAIVSLFTSAGTNQMQSMAHSNDNGYHFEVYDGNPIITLESEARDPNMFWDQRNNRWVLTLAHALEHEMLIFTSPDLKNWTLQSSFGKGLGAQEGVWECPDLWELPVEGTKGQKKWVLVCNINPDGPFGGSATQYFIGDFDGKTFKVDTDAQGNVPTKWMDYGKDHYATVSFSDAPDNRRTVIGWMSNWQYAPEVPTQQFRSSNTLPREISLFKAADGQIYTKSTPSPEVDKLRGNLVSELGKTNLTPSGVHCKLPEANDGVCEITLSFEAKKIADFNMELSNTKGEKVVMSYNSETRKFNFDRTQAGISDFSEDFAAVTSTPTFEKDGKISLRIFIDRASIELFGNDGRFVMTNLVFPNEPYNMLTVSAPKGTVRLDNLKVYDIKLNN